MSAARAAAPLLELDQVTKVFGGRMFDKTTVTAVDNLSFDVPADPPRITAIAGESGSGKTTLARLLLGLIGPTRGRVRYRGRDVGAMSREQRKEFRREIQPVFQDPFEVYNPFYRVDHVLNTPVHNFHLAESRGHARELIMEALETVGLRPEETLGRFPHQLSGGQRQRVMVARALLLKPSVIVADEPVSMVDASLRATILESIRKLNRELGIAILYITHDLTTAFQIADDILVLYQGSVAETGEVGKVIGDPKHPYTRLLVDSIPQADPNLKWGENVETAPADSVVLRHAGGGCKFADRCPQVMAQCTARVPALQRTDPDRAAACFLYGAAAAGEPAAPAQVT